MNDNKNETNEVRITSINMPFSEMVIFMVKWAIASIPALLILTILFGGLIFLGALIGSEINNSAEVEVLLDNSFHPSVTGAVERKLSTPIIGGLIFFGLILAGVIFNVIKI